MTLSRGGLDRSRSARPADTASQDRAFEIEIKGFEILNLLRELVDEVRGLRADLAAKAQEKITAPLPFSRSKLTRDDRERLPRLLPAIAGTHGSEDFHAADIMEHDSPALRLVRKGLTTRKLGKMFARCVGIPIGGYLVERHENEAGSWLWRVVEVVDEFPGNGKVSIPHGPSRGQV